VGLNRLLDESKGEVHMLQQKLRIQEGSLVVARKEIEAQVNSEVHVLREQVATDRVQMEQLNNQNQQLRAELDQARALLTEKDKEMGEWKKRLRMMIDGATD